MAPERGRERPLRLFVAAALPDDPRAAIAEWQDRVLAARPELRVNRELHLTLCFLGDTPVEALPQLQAALAGVELRPMGVAVKGPMLLPERGKRRIVALALEHSGSDPHGLERLHRTQGELTAALVATGHYQPPRRPWLPHVTVARFRRPGQPFPLQNVNFGELCLSRVVLYTSDLDRSGAIHTPLASFSAR